MPDPVEEVIAKRTVMTAPAPGFVPEHLTLDDTTEMAKQIAACCAEAGYPTTPKRKSLFGDKGEYIDWYFDPEPPRDVVDRARGLVFHRWGLIDLIGEPS